MKQVLSIREQIQAKPKMHMAYFACLAMGVVYPLFGVAGESFIAAAFVIAALIDQGS